MNYILFIICLKLSVDLSHEFNQNEKNGDNGSNPGFIARKESEISGVVKMFAGVNPSSSDVPLLHGIRKRTFTTPSLRTN